MKRRKVSCPGPNPFEDPQTHLPTLGLQTWRQRATCQMPLAQCSIHRRQNVSRQQVAIRLRKVLHIQTR